MSVLVFGGGAGGRQMYRGAKVKFFITLMTQTAVYRNIHFLQWAPRKMCPRSKTYANRSKSLQDSLLVQHGLVQCITNFIHSQPHFY